MLERQIDIFLDLLLSPTGLVAVIGLLVSLYLLVKDPRNVWYFVAFMALFASFAEYRDEFFETPPALAFPLQQVRTFGRSITIVILVLITVYLFIRKGPRLTKDVFYIRRSLLIIQLLIFIKNALYGDLVFAVLLFSIFFMVYSIFEFGMTRWLASAADLRVSVFAFIVAVIAFNFAALYQSRIDFSAMLFPSGRFLGMTGNAQHAAVLLASSIPLFVFFIIELRQKKWKAGILLAGLLWSIYYLILTGSRTGMVMAIMCVAIFVVLGYKVASLKWVAAGAVAFMIVSSMGYNPLGGVEETTLERYSSTENSRSFVYEMQVNIFLANPVFGLDPRRGRVGFSENSYLAVAASLGIIGLIPLGFMMAGLFKMVVRLWKRIRIHRAMRHYYLFIIAGIVPLLAGAFTEAYLLGSITWPLTLLLCYVDWGYFVLKSKVPTVTRQVPANRRVATTA